MKERGMAMAKAKAMAWNTVKANGLDGYIGEREAWSLWCENTDDTGAVNVQKFIKDCEEFIDFMTECNSDSHEVELEKIDNSWKQLTEFPF